MYSYVNNFCRGKSNETDKLGRDGQYFALSVVYDGVYLFPEEVYRILRAAYEQMFQRGSVLGYNTKGEVQYRISQFSEEGEYLSAFLEKVITNLDKFVGTGKSLKADSRFADYDSWMGDKVSLDVCNSIASYNRLCEVGRLYISDTYDSPSKKNKVLEEDIQNLKKERADLEERIAKMMKSAGSKARDEIAKLQEVINAQETEIKSSKSQLEEYEATIDAVRKQLDKYAKFGKKISNVQEQTPLYEKKDKKDLLKICLLFIVMLLTIANGVLSYCFFRDFSPTLKKETGGEIAQNVASSQEEQPQTNQTSSTSKFIVSENSITADENGVVKVLVITTDGAWDVPEVPRSAQDWLSFTKIDASNLQISVGENKTPNVRTSTFTIGPESFQQQITVTQQGKVVSEQNCPDYQIVVTDAKGQILADDDTVTVGQILMATISNPEPKTKSGYGWTADGCSLGDNLNKNVQGVTITVTAQSNESAGNKKVVVGYGKLNKDNVNNRHLRKTRTFIRIVP